MSHTLTIRLTPDVAQWLEEESKKTGVPQGRLIRNLIQRRMAEHAEKPFLRLAGSIRGPRDLSSRKGFSRP